MDENDRKAQLAPPGLPAEPEGLWTCAQGRWLENGGRPGHSSAPRGQGLCPDSQQPRGHFGCLQIPQNCPRGGNASYPPALSISPGCNLNPLCRRWNPPSSGSCGLLRRGPSWSQRLGGGAREASKHPTLGPPARLRRLPRTGVEELPPRLAVQEPP